MSQLITVIGAGHLAKFFIDVAEINWNILALTRSPTKLGENPRIQMIKYLSGDNFPPEILASEIVIWSLPPATNYLEVLKQAQKQFNLSTQWIFISSTSVYGNGVITEESSYVARNSNAEILIACEKYLTSIKEKRSISILRPGGLVDHQRHPRHFFAKSKNMAAALTNINLVHTEDVARCIVFLIKNHHIGIDINITSDDHPRKVDFYLPLIQHLNPHICVEQTGELRIIENSKLKKLGFLFKYPTVTDSFS